MTTDTITLPRSVVEQFETSLKQVTSWLEGAVRCTDFDWDHDQKECASGSIDYAKEQIAALTAAIEAAKQEKADQIKTAVDRFLGWKLPENFAPDCHITFDAISAIQTPNSWPIGTNLFTADQAKTMFEHCLEGTTAKQEREAEPVAWLYTGAKKQPHSGPQWEQWASVGDKDHWPVDQWREIKVEPLYTTPQPQVPEGWQLELMDAVRRYGSIMTNTEILSMLAAASKKEGE